MRKYFYILLLLIPSVAFAQFTVPQGGTGTTTFPANWVLLGSSPLRVTAVPTSSLGLSPILTGTTGQVGYFSALNNLIGTSSIFIATTSYVGIGTTSPSSVLEVVTSTTSPLSDATAWEPNGATLALTSTLGNITNVGPSIGFRAPIASGDVKTLAAIKGVVSSTGSGDGSLQFFLRDDDNATLVQKMTIFSTGKVGIGTINPDALLHVAGTGVLKGITVSDGANASNGDNGTLQILPANTAGVSGRILFGTDGSNLSLRFARNVLGSVTDLMGITEGGHVNIGIGASAPDATLSVEASDNSAVPQFLVGSSTQSVLTVLNTGNVGIGTALPDTELTVSMSTSTIPSTISNGTALLPLLHLVTAESVANRILLDSFNAVPTFTARRANGSEAVPSALKADDQIFNFNMFGYGATNYTSGQRGGFGFFAESNWTDTSNPTYFRVLTAGASGGGLERLRVNSVGNLGIGTTSPYATTSIQSNSGTGDAFVVATSSTATIGGYDNDGHRFTAGPPPAISACGTGSGTVVGDDQSGTITTATAATACTATFAKAYRATPVCTVTDNSLVGFADVSTISTTAVTFGISSALTGGLLYYQCNYHR